MSDYEITIYDIAKELNVSTASVSRALQGQKGVSPALREKVQKTADKFGYQRNTFASNLRTQKTKSIGVMIPRIRSEFMSNVIAGIEEVVNQAGYHTMITQSGESIDYEIQNARSLFDNRVDGLLVSLSSETNHFDHFKPFIDKNIPIIFFDRVCDLDQTSSIVIDNKMAAFQLVSHLVMRGYKRIAHISGNNNMNVYKDRLLGYQEALEKNNILFDENLVYIDDLTRVSAAMRADEILNLDPEPDAVFAVNDRVAVCCMKRFKERGLRIPQDIAVAGFNHDFVSEIIEPRLTTVDYPAYEMGQIAANSLLQKIDAEKRKMVPKQIILQSELIIGEST